MELSETEKEIMDSFEEGYSNEEILEALREEGYSNERIQKMISDVKQKMEEGDEGMDPEAAEDGQFQTAGTEPSGQQDQFQAQSEGMQATSASGNTGSLEYASLGQRFLAKVIDFVVAGVLYGLMFGVTFVLPGSLQALSAIFTFVLGPFLPVIYFVGMEGRSGATIGKKLMSIKVVSPDGSPIGYKAALIRNVLAIVDSLPTLYLLGIYMIKTSDQNQRLGDKVADSVVIEA